jgi:hypothetical protein
LHNHFGISRALYSLLTSQGLLSAGRAPPGPSSGGNSASLRALFFNEFLKAEERAEASARVRSRGSRGPLLPPPPLPPRGGFVGET